MVFQTVGNRDELGGAVGHRLFERGILLLAHVFADALQGSPATRALDRDLLRRANAGNHVFALCVDQIFAVEDVLARGGVAAECNARGRVVAHVAVNHGLHVDGRAPFFGNLVHAAVKNGALVHPAVKHGADAAPQLLPGAVGEVLAGEVFHGGLELLDQLLEVVDVELGVELHAFGFFLLVHDGLEGVDVDLALRLHAQNDVAIHLHEAAIAVPCKARVAALFGQRGHCGVVHAQVQHGVHHAGHRGACARADADKQRVGRVVELAAGQRLDVGNGGLDVFLNAFHNFVAAKLRVFRADFGRDGEAGGHRHAEQVHLGEIRALAAKQIAVRRFTFGLSVAECIDSLHKSCVDDYVWLLEFYELFCKYTQIFAICQHFAAISAAPVGTHGPCVRPVAVRNRLIVRALIG